MIQISKYSEPIEWKERRSTSGLTTYESIPALKRSLLEEQGYICAYCMSRIRFESSRIEHIKSRSHYPLLQLDYTNMVLCCCGNTDSTPHCDVAKGDKEISFDLFRSAIQESISYGSKDGRINSTIAQWNVEMNEVLALNHPVLKHNRKAVLEGVIAVLLKKKWKDTVIHRILHDWTNKQPNGEFNPYCGVVIWYLRRKLPKKK